MHAFTIDPAQPAMSESLVGAIICEEVRAGGPKGRRLFHKGHQLTEDDLVLLTEIGEPIHAARLDPVDVHEDRAGLRLAAAVGGPGVEPRGPVQSRVNLIATRKGLLRVDRDAVIALNRLDGIAVFTLLDRLPVVPGKIVAGTKVTPVAIPEHVLREAERSIGAEQPVVTVKPFKPLRVGVITTEGLSNALQTRFRETVTRKIGWYGASVIRFVDLSEQPESPKFVAAAIENLIADGADLILTAGGNTIDPLDPTLQALPLIGAEMVKYGAPAHPGSMFWLAQRWDVPIFNLASCSMYSKATVADLILPLVMAGERVTLDDLAELGYGGLLDRGMSFRFPPYDIDATVEPDEE
jgi:hypothetical protein